MTTQNISNESLLDTLSPSHARTHDWGTIRLSFASPHDDTMICGYLGECFASSKLTVITASVNQSRSVMGIIDSIKDIIMKYIMGNLMSELYQLYIEHQTNGLKTFHLLHCHDDIVHLRGVGLGR